MNQGEVTLVWFQVEERLFYCRITEEANATSEWLQLAAGAAELRVYI